MPARAARGVGIVAALITCGLVGVGDGLLACVRTPRAARDGALCIGVVLGCAGVFAVAGLALGAAQELFVQAAVRRASLRRMARWALGGPSRWFEPDRAAAVRVTAVAGTAAATVYAGGALAARAAHVVRAPPLALLAAACVVPALAVGFAGVMVVLAWPLEWALRRAPPRLASPGAAFVAAGLALAPALVRGWRAASTALDGRAAWTAGVVCAAAAIDGVVVVALMRRARAGRRVRPRAVVAAVAVAVLASAGASVTLDRHRAALSALVLRSALAHRLVGPLQRALDRDGDGYGALFGGGDCDDRDARTHPGARDVPRNGRDENCSGGDALGTDRGGPGAFAPVVGPLAARRPSFALIVVDTLRADHVGAYGYARATTPRLDALAREGARFTRAYAAAPQSVRSLAAAFTGQSPAALCWGRDAQFPALEDENVTIAELLRDDGYATAAFTGTSYFDLTRGFFQGFETVDQAPAFKGEAAATVARARAWLARTAAAGRPFFLWVHVIEPHDPYADRAGPGAFGHAPIDRYDAEIAAADAALAPLLDALAATEAPTIVAVAGDHGEGFGEHGHYFHAVDLHEEALRVPLIVRGPGVVPARRDELVALADLFPTLLNYVGHPAPRPMAARSLVPLLQAPPGGAPVTPAWRRELAADVAIGRAPPTATALLAPPWKLLFDATHGAWELYDLARDPGELRNLVDEEPARLAQLRARLLDRAGEPPAGCAAAH